MRRKMDKKKRKMDKFAIGSFVLALFPFVLWIIIVLGLIFYVKVIIMLIIFFYFINSTTFFILASLSLILSLVFGIISLRRIKNNSLLNGKAIAIVGIVLSILQMVLYLIILFIGFFIKVELYG